MSSMIGMSLLASASAANSFRTTSGPMEGLTNGSKPNNEDDVSKSGKSQISIPPVEEETNSEDYHQMDNNGNLENGQFFTQLIQFLKMRLMF